jgi:hypothetical protein
MDNYRSVRAEKTLWSWKCPDCGRIRTEEPEEKNVLCGDCGAVFKMLSPNFDINKNNNIAHEI